MRINNTVFAVTMSVVLSGCGGSATGTAPQFEVRDFVVTEEKKPAAQYSKEWNKFSGAGTIVARNVEKDRNLVVILEVHDETKGPSSQPQLVSILVRGGVGKVNIEKSNYEEVSLPPKYSWNVIGWYELRKATIEAPGQSSK